VTAVLDSGFSFDCGGGGSSCGPPELTVAFARYKKLVLFAGPVGVQRPAAQPRGSLPALVLSGCDVYVADPSAALSLLGDTDESYEIKVPAVAATTLSQQQPGQQSKVNSIRAIIHAATPWGAMRALETFSQLVFWNGTAWPGPGNLGSYTVSHLPLSISDRPRFPWRGVMLDTSRHWYPVGSILKTLDAMSYNRLNVLHWHATDDNSWSLSSSSYPKFANKSSFGPHFVYSADDIMAVVKYARERGILVYFELDAPSHSGSWGKAYPNLTTWWPKPSMNPGCIVEPTGKAGAALATLTQEYNSASTYLAPGFACRHDLGLVAIEVRIGG
jgi:hexosaminidase